MSLHVMTMSTSMDSRSLNHNHLKRELGKKMEFEPSRSTSTIDKFNLAHQHLTFDSPPVLLRVNGNTQQWTFY